MELNAAWGTNDLVRGLTSLTYGGTLSLSNLAGTVSPSNAFKLFSANSYGGAFAAFAPAIPGPGLAWNTNTLALDGVLRITSTAPVTVSNTISGSLLTLSWPADHIGWRLQAQTNSISAGLGTNWVDVPGSIATNEMMFAINPAAGSVFYRLLYP